MTRFALTVLLALAALPAAAQSAKESPGRIAPGSATSQCIGQPETPICAAETLLACMARGDASLCRSVLATAPQPLPNGVPQLEYVIERVSVIRPESVTDDLKDLEWYRPGYTLVEMLRRTCPASDVSCSTETWEGVQVYLRRRGGGTGPWEIVHWRSEGEPDTPPDEPENFQTATSPAR